MGVMNVVAAAVVVFAAAGVRAGGPAYDDDPFKDADFRDAPLIIDAAHPSLGRADVAALLSLSLVDKYNSHQGLIVEGRYHLLDSFAVGGLLGYLHGALTSIVTDESGIIGNRVSSCAKQMQAGCDEIDPKVPDLAQVTGIATLEGIWAPLYGKISLVSELDVNLQVYALFGAGLNGTRRVRVYTTTDSSNQLTYRLEGGGLFADGLFNDAKLHGAFGLGLRVFATRSLDVRVEVRDLVFMDQFDFGTGPEPYVSHHFLAQLGAGFTFF